MPEPSKFPPQHQVTRVLRYGVVHKLHLEDKVGRWSKNVHFLSTFITQKMSTQVVKKQPKSCLIKCRLLSNNDTHSTGLLSFDWLKEVQMVEILLYKDTFTLVLNTVMIIRQRESESKGSYQILTLEANKTSVLWKKLKWSRLQFHLIQILL